MLQRSQYSEEDQDLILSTKNEPSASIQLKVEIRKYPDMHKAYEGFSRCFGIPASQFILGNGCENVMKSVLLALKPKSLHWSKPAWGFIDVYAAQIDCQPYVHAYKGDLASGFKDEDFEEDTDIYYAAVHANNFIPTDVNWKNVQKSRFSILDLTYLQPDQLKDILASKLSSNIIYVGSFDKLLGCGTRAGFAVFPEQLSQKIQLQRENYVNALAADVFQNLESCCCVARKLSPFQKWHLGNLHLSCKSFATGNYITVQSGQDISFPCKKTVINGITYSRYGMPDSQKTLIRLLHELSQLS